MFQDLRFGARMLLKQRRFTAVAIITLALGIGATTAIFSVVDAVLLRPLPFPEADRLVYLREVNASGNTTGVVEKNLRDSLCDFVDSSLRKDYADTMARPALRTE